MILLTFALDFSSCIFTIASLIFLITPIVYANILREGLSQFCYTKKPVLKLLSFSKQFQGQAVNTYTCGTTLFRR